MARGGRALARGSVAPDLKRSLGKAQRATAQLVERYLALGDPGWGFTLKDLASGWV